MLDDKTYELHQTPPELALKLIEYLPIDKNDTAIDPFRGRGAFFNALRKKTLNVDWTEIREGRDYKEMGDSYSYIVTNPPFEKTGSFWNLLWELAHKATKCIAFLGNDYCFSALTPKRLKMLEGIGFHLNKVIVCNVRKWRGRYRFMIFTRDKNPGLDYLDGYY